MKVAILGAGAFGTALGRILAEKGYDVDYYDQKIEQEKLADVLDGAKCMVLAVPSQAVPYLLPHLPKEKFLIVATKGVLNFATFEKFRDVAVLSGPGFAADIKDRRPTLLTATDLRAVEMFQTDYLEFDMTTDARGVLMCGALKNVYAILAGMLGLAAKTALWDEFINAAAGEMREILAANGALAETVDLSCGIGDLELTCALPSRNFEFGLELRNGRTAAPDKTVEGVSALKKLRAGEIVVPETAAKLQEIIKISKGWRWN